MNAVRKLCIVLLALLMCGCDQAGRYQAVPAAGSKTGEERVWIVDTKTGASRLCYESAAAINCLRPGPEFEEPKK